MNMWRSSGSQHRTLTHLPAHPHKLTHPPIRTNTLSCTHTYWIEMTFNSDWDDMDEMDDSGFGWIVHMNWQHLESSSVQIGWNGMAKVYVAKDKKETSSHLSCISQRNGSILFSIRIYRVIDKFVVWLKKKNCQNPNYRVERRISNMWVCVF